MHVVDGALSPEVVIGGAVLTLAGTAMGLRQLPMERIPAAGVLSAAFFVAALIRVSYGVSSVHLVLNGLSGLVLGWAAFPALLAGLVLQAVFFGFGGVTALGVNALAIAGPAVLVHLILGKVLSRATPKRAALIGGIGGGLAVTLTAVTISAALMLSGDAFLATVKFILIAHLPVIVVEAVVTGFAVSLIMQVKPELLRKGEGA